MARIAGSDDGPSGHSMMRKLACGLCPLAFAIVLPLAALAQGMPAAEPESLGLSTKRLERIAPALRRDIAAGLIPGAVMLVARRGKLAYFEIPAAVRSHAGRHRGEGPRYGPRKPPAGPVRARDPRRGPDAAHLRLHL